MAESTLSPLRSLSGKSVLLLGSTGFLAKIVLAMLLERFSVKRIYVMIRATRSQTPSDRFFGEVLGSDALAPLRAAFGDAFDDVVRQMVVPVHGDLSKPGLGVDDETFEMLKGDVDVVINSAGLVNFNPPLDSAIDANTRGALAVAEFTAKLDRSNLIHVSTCFVAGARSARIREDAPILGYYPNQEDMPGIEFDWKRELEDLNRLIRQVKEQTNDAALEATFKREAQDRLKREGREANPRTLRAAITNQRRRWVQEEQIRLGLKRADHWGWPNIYTYSKALGEQAIAATEGIKWSIVRPAIVESSLTYPFPGWNEGMNTSAPLAYLGLNGQIDFPGTNELILDVVPVDFVSSAIIAAAAALLDGEDEQVYQVAAGDINPCSMARTVTLVGLHKRRKVKEKEAAGEIKNWRAEIDKRRLPVPVGRKKYERLGAPAVLKAVKFAADKLEDMEPQRYGPFSPWITSAKKKTKEVQSDLGKVVDVFDLFMPFIWENLLVFRTENTRSLFTRMDAGDRALLPFDTERLDWRHYWLDVHIPGLERWVFPHLDPVGPKRVPINRDYRDLAELFSSRVKEHGRRTAYRVVREGDVADSFTYRDVRRAARSVSTKLAEAGLGRGDRVMLLSEGRPEWGMSYFGIILNGAACVPVDVELSYGEILNIAKSSEAKVVIASDLQQEKLRENENGEKFPAEIWGFDEVFARAHEFDADEEVPGVKRKPEDVASILFTSGTTGRPKGVVLTDRNFTALTARMNALFELDRTDSLLSVLPPHHTFEFSAGLLMPMAAGASVTYLEERTPDLISRAFEETPVTSLIGVPAVWETLHRKLIREIEDQPKAVELAIKGLMRANIWMRDKMGWNFGRWVFRPMHDAFGGRLRYLVSGAAALKTDIFNDFRGLGFSLYEGYGLTEASPVLTVGWPGQDTPAGSVGWPLPGIDVRIHDPDESGVGEIIARGPTIMTGYLENPEATAETLQDGWLHTGDRGRKDDGGHLFIVGRDKDTIIDTGGKNIYPDEIEELYADSAFINEMSVVGVPADTGPGERVAALVVPHYEDHEDDPSKEEVREKVREHFKQIGSKLPFARRVKIMHLWDGELPRTSTRKVKRAEVQKEIIKLERNLAAARTPATEELSREDRARKIVRRTVASVAQRKVDEVSSHSRLADQLGFDSLMQLELFTALESEFPRARLGQDELSNVETVEDVVRLISRDTGIEGQRVEEVGNQEEAGPVRVPKAVAKLGKAALGWAQRKSYSTLLDVRVEGEGNIPANRNFIVASNHSSHLDMGLVKHALGPFGKGLKTLAAKDYFFDDEYRRAYFENFTNLLPMDRHGSLKKSLRLATDAIRMGHSLLIFPEGTRARDGEMIDFKPAIGHLCLSEDVDILPMYLGGTYEALPVGAMLPKDNKLWVRIGDPLKPEEMRKLTQGMARSAAYRLIAEEAERRVREMGGLGAPTPKKTTPPSKRPEREA